MLFWPISFLGLIFPILFIMNFLFLIYWFLNTKKQIWANLIVLLIGVQHVSNYIGTNPKESTDNTTISILSYNVRIFNAYNWIPSLTKETIFDFLKNKNTDILCIQEFYAPNNIPDLNYNFRHIGKQNKKSEWHMAIYSKYPQIKKATVAIKGKEMNNTCIYSDIIIKKDTIRVYNIHLASNFFKNSDYLFLKNKKNREMRKGISNIIKILKNSYQERAEEVLAIRTHIHKSPYKVIVCGDFNDTPLSYAYNKIKGDLIDSFSYSGKGIGESFVKVPTLRIDYIMHDNSQHFY